MVLRHALGRPVPRAASHAARSGLPVTARRGLAAPASGSFQYQTGDAHGVKYATRDFAGPTSTLALVSKAGTRYQPLPGLAEGLEKFAFRNTNKRSALRLQREAELLGATLFSYHSRESIVLGAKFFRKDLPYFVEVLNEVASDTKYLEYELSEQVLGQIKDSQIKQLANPSELAVASAHTVAFHRGLGEPLFPTSSTPLTKYLSADAIGAYSTIAYNKPNIALVGNGVEHSELGKWAGDFFRDLRSQPASGLPALEEGQSKWYGGEERIAHASGNTIVLAFPGSSSFTGGFFKPEISVLAALLGGQTTIKWSPGFSVLGKVAGSTPGLNINTTNAVYSDAGLLYVSITGSAVAVRDAAFDAVKAIKDIASGKISAEEIKKAKALAQFTELERGQEVLTGLEHTGSGLIHQGKPYQLDESAKAIAGVSDQAVKEAASNLLQFKASVSTVGDLFVLPWAEEIGLQV